MLLGIAVAAVCALPRVRESVGAARNRLWLLIALALTSHLLLDWWNSYGVHPFWPLMSRWFYGDAVYILEPWLWMLLGVAATLNTRTRAGRVLLGGFIAGLFALGTWMHVIPKPALAALLVVAAGLRDLCAALDAAAPIRRGTGAERAVRHDGVRVAGGGAQRDRRRAGGARGAQPDVGSYIAARYHNRFAGPWISCSAPRPPTRSAGACSRSRATRTRVRDDARYRRACSLATRAARRARRTWNGRRRRSNPSRGFVSCTRTTAGCARGCSSAARRRSATTSSAISATVAPTARTSRRCRSVPDRAASCPANLTDWRPPRADLLGDSPCADLRRRSDRDATASVSSSRNVFHAEARRLAERAEHCLPGRDGRIGASLLSIHNPKCFYVVRRRDRCAGLRASAGRGGSGPYRRDAPRLRVKLPARRS